VTRIQIKRKKTKKPTGAIKIGREERRAGVVVAEVSVQKISEGQGSCLKARVGERIVSIRF